MTDNFEQIKSMLTFDSPDDFYFIQIIQRRKENPTMEKNSRALKNYLINSTEKLDLYKPDIIALCNHFNARATIRLNRRSYKECAFKTLSAMAENLANEDYRPADKVYAQVMGTYANDPDKKWFLDMDDILPDNPINQEVIKFLETIEPFGPKYVTIIPSRTGCHLVTKPFNVKKFSDAYPKIEVQKDAPTNIYIP